MRYSVSTAKPVSKPKPTGYKCKTSDKVYWRPNATWYVFDPRTGTTGTGYINNQYDDESKYEPIYDDIVITISQG